MEGRRRRRQGVRVRNRLATGFLLAVLAMGCVGLFVGVPVGVLWGLAQITDSFAAHFVGGLVGIPLAIVALAPILFWINGLYLRVTLAEVDEDGWDDEEASAFRPGGPLEPMLVAAFILALIALCVWFFLFAENPMLTV
jgi:hypothetical protein